jgi:hypothetical protein
VNRRTTPYREDTNKDQGRAFLVAGSAPPEPDKDDPTIMAVATPVVGENGVTCKTPSK